MYFNNTVLKPDVNTNLSEIEQIERFRLLGKIELPDPSTEYTIRTGIYVRVSTGPQADKDKGSIEEQEEAGLKVIEQNDWKYTATYKDIKATSYEENPEEREGLSQALKAAELGLFDVLIIWSDSRLGRNSAETIRMRKKFNGFGVQIYSVKTPFPVEDPRFYNAENNGLNNISQYLNDVMSESEAKRFSARMRFGKMRKAKKGYLPCKVPFGYRKKKKIIIINGKEKYGSETVPVEKELQVVKMMFDWYLYKGWGIRKILENLNEKGYRTAKDKLWNYSSVRYKLKNPVYCSKVRWGWRLSKSRASRMRLMRGHTGAITNGNHKGIISEENFIKVQKRIASRNKMGGRAVSSRGLLTGVIKCGRCGSNAYTTSYPSAYAYKMEKLGKPKDKFARCFAYVCSKVSKYSNKACKRYIISQKRVEEYVVEQIKQLANSPTAQKAFERQLRKDNTKHLRRQITTCKIELNKLPEQKKRISVAYREGVMKIDDYGKNIAELEDKENKFNTEIEGLEQGIEKSKVTEDKVNKAIKAFQNFNLIWDSASFDKKKDLIMDIMKEVRATSRKIEIDFNL